MPSNDETKLKQAMEELRPILESLDKWRAKYADVLGTRELPRTPAERDSLAIDILKKYS